MAIMKTDLVPFSMNPISLAHLTAYPHVILYSHTKYNQPLENYDSFARQTNKYLKVNVT